ncbi:putative reverse transcriptase domain-containing protein [Tanacetum coccineum]
MPIEPSSFSVIIGMFWLTKCHVVIMCDEKVVCVPYGNKVLIVQGDRSDARIASKLNIISCTTTQKYTQKGCHVFLAQITEKKAEEKSEEKRLEDVPIVRDFQNVPILALPEGSENFVVYCDASHTGLGAILMQKEKVIAYASRQLKVHENNYTTHDLELGVICYHPGKANVVADALSRKERIKLLRVRALVMTIDVKLSSQILNAQAEATKEENFKEENMRGINKEFETRSNGTLYIEKRCWLPRFRGLRDLIISESHKAKYSIHPGSDKMYQDLKKLY